jgi:adenine-specific DNA-methyltransferase
MLMNSVVVPPVVTLPTYLGEKGSVVAFADWLRLDASRRLNKTRQVELGQYFTSATVARRLATLFKSHGSSVRLLDAGAGVGMLTAAFVEEMCSRKNHPESIHVTAYELDTTLHNDLQETLQVCHLACAEKGIDFSWDVLGADFIENAVNHLHNGLFAVPKAFNCAILNPPYKKIGSHSKERILLQQVGIETGNLYTAFLALAARLLENGGELVAITPRSFCNGSYFKPFRQAFLREMSLHELQLFENRKTAFEDVLQENILFKAVKSSQKPKTVRIVTLDSPEDDMPVEQMLLYQEVIKPTDPEQFIHIVPDGMAQQIARSMQRFTHTLEDLGLTVSTGRVVDFRAKEALRLEPEAGTAPLLYPHNLQGNDVVWPVAKGDKPQALVINDQTQSLLIPKGVYVLIKRFSAKEEKRRVVAAVYDPERIKADVIGIENHLNYVHQRGQGLPELLAKGLAVFLNSTLVDQYVRQFNGHTQVNATDLRNLHYPSKPELEKLGSSVTEGFPDQPTIDTMMAMTFSNDADGFEPGGIKRRIEEALGILALLGLPKAQLNERSALTLLALLDMKPATPWAEASAPLIGITPMMDFMAEHYGKKYKPNTRETVRRQTMHQFVDAGIAIPNPDDPRRPPNSPKWVYQIEPSALKLLRTFGSGEWDASLATFLASLQTLRERYAQSRMMERIPVRFNDDVELTLSPGGQNELVEKIIHEFSPRFVPGGQVIYLGDTDDKWLYFDKDKLQELGVTIEEHGKMPDVVIHHTDKNWLLLVEAVTSHGPINPKRMGELKQLFSGSKAGLVFVTTFLTRKAMLEYLSDIAWETEVWVAESPEHMIHFNGERFLGPYKE